MRENPLFIFRLLFAGASCFQLLPSFLQLSKLPSRVTCPSPFHCLLFFYPWLPASEEHLVRSGCLTYIYIVIFLKPAANKPLRHRPPLPNPPAPHHVTTLAQRSREVPLLTRPSPTSCSAAGYQGEPSPWATDQKRRRRRTTTGEEGGESEERRCE